MDYSKILEGKADDEKMKILLGMIPFIHEECEKLGVGKIFDNYNFRQQDILNIMKGHWPNVILSKKRTGRDAWSTENPVLNNIEMKSCAGDKLKSPLDLSFPFDKQNDEKRRKETLEYDSFAFAGFYMEKARIVLLAEDPHTIEHLNTLLRKEQEEFLKRWTANIAAEKRGGNDAVRLFFKNMLVGDYKWHLCIDNVWHKEIKSSECVLEITKFNNTMVKPRTPKKEKTAEEKAAISAKAKITRVANNLKKSNAH